MPNSSGATRKASAACASITWTISARARRSTRSIAFGERLADIGWHLQIHMAAERIGELAPALKRSPVPVVIDHMGRIDASRGLEQEPFRNLLSLMQDRKVWVKVSGADRATRQGPPYADAVPFARKLVAEFGDRCVWGTDFPHPNHTSHTRRRRAGRYCWRRSRPSRRSFRRCWSTIRSASTVSASSARCQGGKIMSGRLQDKIAIVTGAGCVGPGWGNGRATCVRFAEEGAKIFARRPRSRQRRRDRRARKGGRRRDRAASMRRHRQCLGRRHGGGLRRNISAASTCWSTMSAARRMAGRWK